MDKGEKGMYRLDFRVEIRWGEVDGEDLKIIKKGFHELFCK